MNEIITTLIASAIDKSKIPGLDYIHMSNTKEGSFEIFLNDLSVIQIDVKVFPNVLD